MSEKDLGYYKGLSDYRMELIIDLTLKVRLQEQLIRHLLEGLEEIKDKTESKADYTRTALNIIANTALGHAKKINGTE